MQNVGLFFILDRNGNKHPEIKSPEQVRRKGKKKGNDVSWAFYHGANLLYG